MDNFDFIIPPYNHCIPLSYTIKVYLIFFNIFTRCIIGVGGVLCTIIKNILDQDMKKLIKWV